MSTTPIYALHLRPPVIADVKERRGFRVNARERKRLDDARTHERELAEGHAKFLGLFASHPPIEQRIAALESRRPA